METPSHKSTYAFRILVVVGAIALVVSNVVLVSVVSKMADNRAYEPRKEVDTTRPYGGHGDDRGSCNVRGVALRGDLYTYLPPQSPDDVNVYDATSSEDVVAAIRDADEDDEVKAILVDIDSPGGGPVAGEEIANALRDASKPVVAVIREMGDSAAYWAATGADLIFASANSDVGSIGVTSSYVDNSAQNSRDGLQYVELSSGKFKDTGSPDKPLTPAERELILRDIKIVHQNFVASVAANRNLTVEQVTAMADGSSMTGQMALEKNLIDRIGSFQEAEKYLGEQIDDDVEVCW